MPKKHVHPLKARLNEAGLRATPARLAVAEFLARAHQPLGTPVIADQFVPETFDLATLYRMLKSFETANLVRLVPIDQRFATYEWVEAGHGHHHHLVCESCGLIEEIPPCDLEHMEKKVLAGAPRFAAVTSHSLEFFGVCRSCESKNKKRH